MASVRKVERKAPVKKSKATSDIDEAYCRTCRSRQRIDLKKASFTRGLDPITGKMRSTGAIHMSGRCLGCETKISKVAPSNVKDKLAEIGLKLQLDSYEPEEDPEVLALIAKKKAERQALARKEREEMKKSREIVKENKSKVKEKEKEKTKEKVKAPSPVVEEEEEEDESESKTPSPVPSADEDEEEEEKPKKTVDQEEEEEEESSSESEEVSESEQDGDE